MQRERKDERAFIVISQGKVNYFTKKGIRGEERRILCLSRGGRGEDGGFFITRLKKRRYPL